MPDDAPWIEPVVVPDDLRDLQPDIEAYHREQRQAARRERIARITRSRLLLPIGMTFVAVALAAAVFGILTFGQPAATPLPAPEPTATHPLAATGELHGLLPDVPVRTHTGVLSARDLRPALYALVPLHCECTALLAELASQADEVRVPLVVVAPGSADAEIDTLAGRLHRGRAIPVFDATGALATTYDASGVTVLVVAADATVDYVQTDVTTGVRLEMILQQLVDPPVVVSGIAR